MNALDNDYTLKDGSTHKGLIELVRYLVRKEVDDQLDDVYRKINENRPSRDDFTSMG